MHACTHCYLQPLGFIKCALIHMEPSKRELNSSTSNLRVCLLVSILWTEFFCPCKSAFSASSQTAQLKCNSNSATAIDGSQGLLMLSREYILDLWAFLQKPSRSTPGHHFESLQPHYTSTIAMTVIPADNCIGNEDLILYPKKGNDSQIKCRMEQWLK